MPHPKGSLLCIAPAWESYESQRFQHREERFRVCTLRRRACEAGDGVAFFLIRLKPWAEKIGVAGAIGGATALLIAHFVHPRADFPNFSPWMDYAKYTDEGWYGNAAVAYFIRGGWYVPGDFNPAVALPVWPFLEWILFHITGVSLVAARLFAIAIFGGNLALTYALVRSRAPRWSALLAVVVLASNAFLYCFSRLAILEPLLIFFMLLSWLLALKVPMVERKASRTATLVAIGLLLCAMVLTKTTAIFLLPAVFYLLWAERPTQRGVVAASWGIVTASATIPWLIYYLVAVRPHYLEDYHYLFTANVYTQPTTIGGWLMAFWYSFHGALWIDRTLAVVVVALLCLSFLLCRRVWQDRLFAASFLACAGYLFFIGYHNNMQPRYYQVIAFPLAMLAVLALNALFSQRGQLRIALGTAAALAMAWMIVINTHETLWFAAHPQYTFVNAAENLTQYIDQHPNRNRLLLSISGSNIALITGLPAICDDFGTLDLPDRIRKYQPGWYAAWNELDPGTLEDLHTQFNLQQVANFPAYDDEDRDNLILYKLIPIQQEKPKPLRPRRQRRLPLGAERGNTARFRRVAE
jgi:4-amino-4-deoxy-L-arabinose transferase-like glycosyltransferase